VIDATRSASSSCSRKVRWMVSRRWPSEGWLCE
jgi:hypothetical protein